MDCFISIIIRHTEQSNYITIIVKLHVCVPRSIAQVKSKNRIASSIFVCTRLALLHPRDASQIHHALGSFVVARFVMHGERMETTCKTKFTSEPPTTVMVRSFFLFVLISKIFYFWY